MWMFLPLVAYILHLFPVAAMDTQPDNTSSIYVITLIMLFLAYFWFRLSRKH